MTQDQMFLVAITAPPRHDLILGLPPFAFVHVVITLVAIAAGLAVLSGMLGNQRREWPTAIFLAFSVLTAVTGFLLQITPLTPAVVLGFILGGLLILALAGKYLFRLRDAWRWIYALSVVASLYLNCFVLVVQSFQKVAPLAAFSHNNNATPFILTQVIVLVLFVVSGFLAVRRFHPA
ncbi:MAG TPA: hypothetical protein VII56_14995 [Rhizomicrobium sp.]